MEIYDVVLRKKLGAELRKLPKHIIAKLSGWVNAVGHYGLSEVRKFLAIMMNLYKESVKVSAQ